MTKLSRLISTSTVTLASLLLVLTLSANAAHADRIAVVVGGEPSKSPFVVDAAAEWLTTHGHTPVVNALDASSTSRLVECYVSNDEPCTSAVVASAKVDGLIFVMVDLQQTDVDGRPSENITLTGWRFDGGGTQQRAERRFCDDCRVTDLSTNATDLVNAMFNAVTQLSVESDPVGARILIDGNSSGVTPALVPTTPGKHQLQLTKDGYKDHRQDVVATEGESTKVSATLSAVNPGAGIGPIESGTKRSKLPYLVIAGGAAMVITGGVLFAIDEDEVNSDGVHVPEYRDSATAGIIVGSAGVVAVGVGIALLIRGKKSDSSTPTVSVAAGGLSLGWAGSF